MSDPDRPLPESLTRFLPERPAEPTPEDQFRTYLAQQETAGSTDRPKPEPGGWGRIVLNAFLLGGSFLMWGTIGWRLGRWAGWW